MAKDDDIKTFDVNEDEIGEKISRPVDEVPPEEEIAEIEEERKARLDPDNRPENAEVDNTGRTFNSEAGDFEDNLD